MEWQKQSLLECQNYVLKNVQQNGKQELTLDLVTIFSLSAFVLVFTSEQSPIYDKLLPSFTLVPDTIFIVRLCSFFWGGAGAYQGGD